MQAHFRREYLFGAIIAGAGLVYLYLTAQIPRKGGVDATFVPYLLAAILTFLGILQLAATRFRQLRAAPAGDPQSSLAARPAIRPDYRTMAITVMLIAGYIALLEPLGFFVVSALYLFLQILVFTPKKAKKNCLLAAFISLAASGLVFYVFRLLFDLMLPLGLLRHITTL